MARQFGRGGGGFARPENALKRADELENVGQKQSALQALHDIITSKKHRTWSKTYESIMLKHIDLVVEMKKRNYAKEALMQYRNMCQAVNINSLEEVIKYFLKAAGDKAEEAQSKAAAVTLDVEDLEADASPEDLMLSYVSAEKSKDRTDRELVTPWFRFLWESYRSVLDILRTNPKLEPLYAMTANKAFQFCLQYKRTSEFRRLCDILRQHLTNLTLRYRDNREAALEMLQLHLETRFEQLRVACELELWAEAFRSVEDIQALIALARKQPKQQLMATYYARLTQIFAKSESHMYHAYAWLKLFNFSKSYNKNMTPQDLQMMACSVLLATLSILPYDRQAQQDDANAEQDKERILRMANILGFAVDSKKDYKNLLSRGALLGSISAMNILALVPPEVRSIYELLTSDFNPLELCGKLAPLIEKLQELSAGMSAASPVKDVALGQYVATLKQVAVLRLLKQLGEVYSTMKISSVAAMVPFANFSEVEGYIVDAVKWEFLQVRIDHRNGTLHFGSQQLESDRIKQHLSLLAKRLSKAAHMFQPAVSEGKEAKRAQAVKAALETLEADHRRFIARKIMIEKRKEEQEQALLQQEKEEEMRKAIAAREAEMAEEKRRREEAIRRDKERIERELEERELEEARQMLEAVKAKKAGGAKTAVTLKEGEKLNKQAIMQEAYQERLKEQQEMERKLARTARQMDHLERAKREEEGPLLQEAYEKRVAEDKAEYEAQAALAREAHHAQWERDLAEKQRLAIMLQDKESFQAIVVSRREEEFQQLRTQRERRMAEKRAMRARERQVQRRRKYVQLAMRQVEERLQELEDERRQQEEEKRVAEEEERRRKLEETMERQRQREAEIEARMKEEREKQRAAPAPAAPAAAAAGGAGGGARFVPPHLRSRGGEAPAPAAPAAEEEAPAAREERAESGEGADGWRRGGAPAAAGPREDRWGGPRRDDGPAAAPREDRWGGPRREEGPSRDAPRAGAFVPSARREGGSGAAPPADRPRYEAPRAAASSGPAPSGGAYKPPSRR